MVDLQIRELAARMDESDLAIHLTEPARYWLAKQGFDPQFGARPLAPRYSASYRKSIEPALAQRRLPAPATWSSSTKRTKISRLRATPTSTAITEKARRSRPAPTMIPFVQSFPERDFYDAEYEDDDFADFLSQTDDDDEFDPFPSPPTRRHEDIDRLE